MASVFTFQDEPHRVHSPWSTPGNSTPQRITSSVGGWKNESFGNQGLQITRLEPEKHDGPTEYKLHLLLRSRRNYTFLSTISSVSMVQALKIETNGNSPRSLSEPSLQRLISQPSSHNRQARLQQLTTQLLWRLQQSSPFHSSSNAKLVLPVLPEATPRLGVPDRPSKLLPGLEESQGALYEIGVADDGTLLGLTEEELEESLTNLRAMASSLGCVVDVLRRVLVGRCEWVDIEDGQLEPISKTGDLWVAEVLVRPDNKHVEIIPMCPPEDSISLGSETEAPPALDVNHDPQTEQFRIAIIGASVAGKSSLLGTLTNSALDNGRGKSRLSLLKHRHEIASGVTSSVAQELVGYKTSVEDQPFVVNYASGDVSSWSDIHNLASRLVFLSDSPGLPRYAKSTFRSLLSWDPTWVVSCVAADHDEQGQPALPSASTGQGSATDDQISQVAQDTTLLHIALCLKLDLRLIVVITKMDLATRSGLRNVLSKVLSTLKASGKVPVVLSAASTASNAREETDVSRMLGTSDSAERNEIDRVNARIKLGEPVVPIIMTSAVTGVGISKLHTLLSSIPAVLPTPEDLLMHNDVTFDSEGSCFEVDEVFAIPPSRVYSASENLDSVDEGTVLCGLVKRGLISLGDELVLGPFAIEHYPEDEESRQALRKPSSHSARTQAHSLMRSFSENFSKSLQLDAGSNSRVHVDAEIVFTKVRIVSLRNLRLPVRCMRQGDTGTVGVQLIDTANTTPSLSRARKGMILATPAPGLTGFRSFSASFPASDFGGTSSPPLVLGGHAIAYARTIRAAIKVMAVALDDGDDTSPQRSRSSTLRTTSHEVFTFDDDDVVHDKPGNGTVAEDQRDIRITFKFVSTVEYLELGSQVLVVPTMMAAGPVTGPTSIASTTGLSGFFGRVCELH